jgi:hypothetical protein
LRHEDAGNARVFSLVGATWAEEARLSLQTALAEKGWAPLSPFPRTEAVCC